MSSLPAQPSKRNLAAFKAHASRLGLTLPEYLAYRKLGPEGRSNFLSDFGSAGPSKTSLAALRAHATRHHLTLEQYFAYRELDAEGKDDFVGVFGPKWTHIYLAVFTGRIKIGKAARLDRRKCEGAVVARVNHAAHQVNESTPEAWAIALAEIMPWSESQQVEHAAAGKLAANIGANPRPHSLDWLTYDRQGIDWRSALCRAVRQTLAFLDREQPPDGPYKVRL
jgi:hypothetical protein